MFSSFQQQVFVTPDISKINWELWYRKRNYTIVKLNYAQRHCTFIRPMLDKCIDFFLLGKYDEYETKLI